MSINQLRRIIQEEMVRLYENNKPWVNSKPANLKNNSRQKLLGDPLEDVKLNTMKGKAVF